MRLKTVSFWVGMLALSVFSLMPTALLPNHVFSLWDKAQHALGFAGLTALGFRAYPAQARWLPWLLLAHGGLIELAQSATGWRQGDWIDWLADAVGILVASLLWFAMVRRPSRAT